MSMLLPPGAMANVITISSTIYNQYTTSCSLCRSAFSTSSCTDFIADRRRSCSMHAYDDTAVLLSRLGTRPLAFACR